MKKPLSSCKKGSLGFDNAMSRLKSWSPFIMLGVLFVGLLVPKWILSGSDSAESGPRGETPRQVVKVMEIAPRDFAESLTLNGTILADNSVDLRSEISGKVVAIHFEDGQQVEKDQLLLEIDDSEWLAERKRILSNLELAELQENRQRRLLDNGGSSVQNYDEARIRRQSLEADLELLDARLAKTKIRAPFDGTVGLRTISIGSYLQPTQNLLTLQQLDQLKVDFSIPERYLGQVIVGLPVELNVAGSSETYNGTVSAISPQIDRSSRTFMVRATVSDQGQGLKPGAYTVVRCQIERKKNAILIPSGAIIPSLGRQSVFVLENNTAVEREVSLGMRTQSETEIVSGLNSGETLIISGIQSLRSGSPVEVLN